MSGAAEAIRAFYQAYHERDRAAASMLIDEAFRFTGPEDEPLGKADWFTRCWPAGDRHVAFEEERLIADGDGAFLTYLVTIEGGESLRNTEYFEVLDGRILSLTLYRGRSWHQVAPNAAVSAA